MEKFTPTINESKNKQCEIKKVSSKAQVTFQTPWGTIKQEIFMTVIIL